MVGIAAVLLAAAISAGDAAFLREAIQLNDDELARAQVAIDSENSSQREYAQRVTTDMGTQNEQLIALDRRFRVPSLSADLRLAQHYLKVAH